MSPQGTRPSKEITSLCYRNRGCKLTLQNDTEEELTLDGENSASSIFCTPKEYPLCNNEEHPLVTQRILKHFEETGCDIIGQTKSESCRQQSTSRKVSIINIIIS